MQGFLNFKAIRREHKELTAAILTQAIQQGHFPGARRHGQTEHYLPDDEVAAFVKFRKLPRGEQIRLFHKDRGLIMVEEVSQLIGIGLSYLSHYRRKGLLPGPRFKSFCGKHVYHIADVMRFVEENRMVFDENLAKKFGWNAQENGEKNSESEDAAFNPMLQKRGASFEAKENS